MALDKKNRHNMIDIMQIIVGKILVKPFVLFKKPFDEIPSIIAKKR